ncbi:MAG: phosphohexomutase domain-containing protein [Planctomycetota bacterium]|jgi:phosphoglucosamine mutase
MSEDSVDKPFQAPSFGTDGLRGPVGSPPMDPETIRRVGAAFGIWLQRQGPERKRVVIGNDGRDSSIWILECLAQGLWVTETSVVDVDLCTTPALAYLAGSENFVGGVMISASHNPASDNGIKIFNERGGKLSNAAEAEIAELSGKIEFDAGDKTGIKEGRELLGKYGEYLANRFSSLELDGSTIVVDAANGGGSQLAPEILRGLGADVVELACEPDGYNINSGVGALHPENIVEAVRASAAVMGICLDGDGDRGIYVDDQGAIRNGDDVIATLAPHFQACGRLPGKTAVATVMSNLGLKKQLESEGLRLEMTPVGDRSVSERMRAGGFALGGEQSGHVIIAQDGPWGGDGLATALEILSIPGVLEKGSSEHFRSFAQYPQVLINIEVGSKPDLQSVPGVEELRQEIEADLAGDGRVFLRYSGTENLCRVLVEGPEQHRVETAAKRLADHLRKELAP